MMRTMAVEERLRRGRMEAKTRDAMFRAKIEHGAKCAPFVSAAILQTLKEVYPVEADDLEAQLELGRVRMLVEPAKSARLLGLTVSCHPARATLRNYTNSAREFFRRARFFVPIACSSRRPVNSGAQSLCVTNALQPRT